MTYYQKISLLQSERNWNDCVLAQKIGCHQSQITHWKDGSRIPSLRNTAKLSKALGITIDELLKEVEL